jgi:hypothetical protein
MSSKDEKKEDPKIEAGDKSSGDSARKGTGSSNKGTSLIGRGNDRPPRRQAPYQQDAQR